jgi:5'-AMP-activated protein kinase regulatory beta subunit
VIRVRGADNNVFDALACDSFALKDQRGVSDSANDEDRINADLWTQEKPGENSALHSSSALAKCKGPPILPPHLLQVLLNKEVQDPSGDPVLLPEPSHVSLNHLYAQSIRDNMLVLSTTTRYRKKCVTVLLYKPLEV